MTRAQALRFKVEKLTESLTSLSESRERMFNRAFDSADKALLNADDKDERMNHRFDEWSAKLEKKCIEAKLAVIQEELTNLTNKLIEDSVK